MPLYRVVKWPPCERRQMVLTPAKIRRMVGTMGTRGFEKWLRAMRRFGWKIYFVYEDDYMDRLMKLAGVD